MIWEEYKTVFTPDGYLRHILIKDISSDDWQAFVDFLRRTEATLDYSIDGQLRALPDNIKSLLIDQKQSKLLTIHLEDVAVHCHFFTSEYIKLDFEPNDIDSEPKAKVIFRLMSTTGRTLNKPVILTSENNEHKILFIYEPGKGIDYISTNKKLSLLKRVTRYLTRRK